MNFWKKLLSGSSDKKVIPARIGDMKAHASLHSTGFLMHRPMRKNVALFFFLRIGLCLAAILFCSCNKESKKETSLPPPLFQVTLSFDVFNHTQGYLTSLERVVKSAEKVMLKIRDLEMEEVDSERIVVREERFGALTAFGKAGWAVFNAPTEDRQYTIYLMNASHGVDYRAADTWTGPNEGILEYAPPIKWYREDRDSYQGLEDEIRDAVDHLNDALSYDWATYGTLIQIEQKANSSFGVGYGHCRNQFGWHNPYWAGINPEHCVTTEERLATFLEELFELITRLNDIGGKDTAGLITDPDTGKLNEKGKDLLAYVFVKDRKI